ncbi:hypothetical protein [Planosporangium flavigriseum]|uniref:hypothetical protein n=1 Tax=Planosporangium flavigriseum TaxID=373681 RepID=UPI0019504127|nr:hypothetical protein [Planosporangium flavigriseum]
MHRRLAYLLAWSVAAMITVSAAWLGIRSVLVAAAPTRPAPLAAAQLRRVAPLTQPSSSASPSSSTSSSTGARSPGTGPSSGPAASAPGTPDPAASNPAVTNPAASSAGTWQADGAGFRRTFRTIGGDVGFFTAKDVVQVASSSPKPGYTVNVTRYGQDSVMVSFFGNRKTSRVWVRWWNGPYGEVTESVD